MGKEQRKSVAKKQEYSQPRELRMVGDEGIFEGYLTTWDAVDSYNSKFQKGCFKKTISERGSKIKVFYDHEHLVGSSVELREDDRGVFAVGKMNLTVPKAQEAYAFMKDGTLEGLSFGFRAVKEGFSNGVRIIKEVQLFEYGPVIFPASDESLITNVRSTDFAESLVEEKLDNEGSQLNWSLNATLSHIWFSDVSNDQIISTIDKAISDFRAEYLDYANRFLELTTQRGYRSAPGATELEKRFRQMLDDKKLTIEQLAQETSYTLTELNELRAGKLIANRDDLNTLSDDIVAAHNTKRNEVVESLCSEIRGKLTASEKRRIGALLTVVDETPSTDLSDILNYFKSEQNIGDQPNG